LFPFFLGRFANSESYRIFKLSQQIIVAGGVKVVQSNIDNIVFGIGRVQDEFLVPQRVKSFLDGSGLDRSRLSLNSYFYIRIRGTAKVSGFDASCFKNFNSKLWLVELCLTGGFVLISTHCCV
jgi:hypothetical protein